MPYISGRVPVQWKCHSLQKTCEASKDAVFDGRYGWICDCGSWVRDGDNLHTIIRRDIRTVMVEQ